MLFFSAANPPLYTIKYILNFVEELVDFKRKSDKADEIDNMTLIQEGCLKLRRKLAKAVANRGGNAIIAYRQFLDNEGTKSKRIVVRGYGTVAYLVHQDDDDQFSGSVQMKKLMGGKSGIK